MLLKRFFIVLFMLLCRVAIADDTELFIADLSAQHGIRPQVLIIFDNSGSMRSSEEVIKEPFDATKDYGAGSDANKIYWTKVGGEVPSVSSSQYFLTTKNNCQASLALLDSEGLYNGNVRRWVVNKKSSRSRWKTLYKNDGDFFECKEDVLNAEPSNPATGSTAGFPIDGRSGPYISTVNNVFSGNDAVTLFSANYIYWYNTVGVVNKSRLQIAKEAIESLIRSTPSVDFGLAVFNTNNGDYSSSKNGGRVVDQVTTRTEAQSDSLITKVNNLYAETWTPLCETMYEAYRYYAGKAVYYGDDDPDATPARDSSAEESGVYLAPFK
ncbi:MAG: hypothetical protein OQK77_01435, partial [Psychromonas sp.]|nr:hypothetical protein [Psychromonas sp.]